MIGSQGLGEENATSLLSLLNILWDGRDFAPTRKQATVAELRGRRFSAFLMLQPDLLGGWTLVRESGQIGGRSQLRRDQFMDQDSALAALEKARDQHIKRGYQLMFTQGADAPR